MGASRRLLLPATALHSSPASPARPEFIAATVVPPEFRFSAEAPRPEFCRCPRLKTSSRFLLAHRRAVASDRENSVWPWRACLTEAGLVPLNVSERRRELSALRAVLSSVHELRAHGGGRPTQFRCIQALSTTGIWVREPRGAQRKLMGYMTLRPAAGARIVPWNQRPQARTSRGASRHCRPCSSGHLTSIWSCQPRAHIASRRGRTYLQLESAAPLARARLQLKCGPLGGPHSKE